MPPLNLAGIKRFAEGQMSDAVRITRDPQGATDDVWDEDTGQYVPVEPDLTPVYEGEAMVVQLNVFPSQTVEGGATTLNTDFECHLPLESPKVEPDDVVTVLACMRTPLLVGEEYIVRSSEISTFSVTQGIRMYNKKQRIVPAQAP